MFVYRITEVLSNYQNIQNIWNVYGFIVERRSTIYDWERTMKTDEEDGTTDNRRNCQTVWLTQM